MRQENSKQFLPLCPSRYKLNFEGLCLIALFTYFFVAKEGDHVYF